jgi:hypothetical protein
LTLAFLLCGIIHLGYPILKKRSPSSTRDTARATILLGLITNVDASRNNLVIFHL